MFPCPSNITIVFGQKKERNHAMLVNPTTTMAVNKQDRRVFLAVHDLHHCITLEGVDVLLECIWTKAQPDITQRLSALSTIGFRTRDDLPFQPLPTESSLHPCSNTTTAGVTTTTTQVSTTSVQSNTGQLLTCSDDIRILREPTLIRRRRSSTQRSTTTLTTSVIAMPSRARSAGPRLYCQPMTQAPLTLSISAPMRSSEMLLEASQIGRKRTLKDFGFTQSDAPSGSITQLRGFTHHDLPLRNFKNLFSCPRMTLYKRNVNIDSTSSSMKPVSSDVEPTPSSMKPASSDIESTSRNIESALSLNDSSTQLDDGESDTVTEHQRAMRESPSSYGINFEARALQLYNQVMHDQAQLDVECEYSHTTVSGGASNNLYPESNMRYRRIVTLKQTSAVFKDHASATSHSLQQPVYLVLYIRGRMDAVSPSRDAVIEIKNRIHPLFEHQHSRLWLREWLQIQSYMHVKDMPRAHLVECYWQTPLTADLRVVEVARDEKTWDRCISPALEAFACLLYELMFLASEEECLAYLARSTSERLRWVQRRIQAYRSHHVDSK